MTKADFQKLSIDKDNDIVVVKINTNYYDVEDATIIYNDIVSRLSDYNVIGIPTGIDLEVETLDFLINKLIKIKEDCLKKEKENEG